MRRKKSWLRACDRVTNGRATAPPTDEDIMGVSTCTIKMQKWLSSKHIPQQSRAGRDSVAGTRASTEVSAEPEGRKTTLARVLMAMLNSRLTIIST